MSQASLDLNPNITIPETDQEKIQWLRLIRSENVGPKAFQHLLQICGSVEKAIEKAPELSKRGGRKREITITSKADAEKEYALLLAFGATLITKCEKAYPERLKHIADAPPVLTVQGDVSLLNKPSVALVGARNASHNAFILAKKLSADLGAANYVCVSGLARGIDTAVHQGSLATGTIGAIAGGIDHIYPKENAELYTKMRSTGCIVTEMPFGAVPKPEHFPRRNRIISGISLGTIVVEATTRSGSLITARMALEQGREVFAVPGFPLDPRAAGPNKLLKNGATLIEAAEDVIEHIRFTANQSIQPSAMEETNYGHDLGKDIHEDALNDIRKNVLSLLSTMPTKVDTIIQETGASTQAILTILLELELAGRLVRHPGNQVSILYT